MSGGCSWACGTCSTGSRTAGRSDGRFDKKTVGAQHAAPLRLSRLLSARNRRRRRVALPPPLQEQIHRDAAQDDPDIDREAGGLADEIIAKQKERGHEKYDRDERVAPRAVGALELRPGASQH